MPIDRTPCSADVSAWRARDDRDGVPVQPGQEAAQDRLVPDVAIAIGADHQDRAAQPVSDDAHGAELASRTRTPYGPKLRSSRNPSAASRATLPAYAGSGL